MASKGAAVRAWDARCSDAVSFARERVCLRRFAAGRPLAHDATRRSAMDLRHALRLVRRQPGFALTAILTLALGVGANTAIFSIVQAVLLRPLPFRDPERLALVWETNPRRGDFRNVANPGNFLAWKERNQVFEDMAAFTPWEVNLAGEGGAERIPSGAVTSSFFSVLGVRPQLGR